MTNRTRILSNAALIVLFTGLGLAQETKEVQKSGKFEQNGRVFVDTYKGSIDVLPWDKSEIEIHAIIEADGSDRRSRERVQDTEIRIDLSSNSARIKTDYERAKRHHDGFLGLFETDSDNLPEVHYTIKVPRTTRLDIKDYKSKTTIHDLQSDVDIETYKGEVDLGHLSGSLNLQTYKGEARVAFAEFKGKSRAETYKGKIEITVPRGKGFDLEANLGRHADFRSDFDVDKDRHGDRRRGYDVETSFNGGGPLLRLKSDRGTIRLLER